MARVSILMTVYNCGRYLENAIKSVLGQSFQDFEFVIVDDGSTDNTKEIINSYRDKRIVVKTLNTNQGRIRALRIGSQLCGGEYISILDADDEYEEDKIQVQVSFLDNNPACGLVASNYSLIDESGRFICTGRDFPVTSREIKDRLLTENFIKHGSTMFRKSIFDAIGGYRLEFEAALDYDFLLRVSEVSDICIIDKLLFRSRLTHSQMSCKRFLLQRGYSQIAQDLTRIRRKENIDLFKTLSKEEVDGYVQKRLNLFLADPKNAFKSSLLWSFQISNEYGAYSSALKIVRGSIKDYPFDIRGYAAILICTAFFLLFRLKKINPIVGRVLKNIETGLKKAFLYGRIRSFFINK